MKAITILPALFFVFSAFAQEINIIPKPAEMIITKSNEKFLINKQTKIILNHGSGLEKFSKFFNDYLQTFYGFSLKVEKQSANTPKSNIINLSYNRLAPGSDTTRSYSLKVTKNNISITSRYSDQLFYGMQTLIQLLPLPNPNSKTLNLQIPQLTIKDYPRFPYRGMHLDVSRHFFPVSFIKKYIDYLALHKFNYFHWHLTEDQGWRIEIKKYPKLTEIGAWRNGTIIGRYPGKGNDGIRYGGFYTQEEIKEIVKYAADRYITVIPEIELPGHSSAAIASYPELSCFPEEPTIKYFPKQCTWNGDSTGKQVQQTWGVFDDVYCAGKENTFKFLQDVFDEVLALFPSKYIHVGGDECPKENWKRCPHCQKRIKDEGLKDEHELQSYFIQRMEKYLNSKGRTLIGWDEILEGGLAPNAVVMSWRGEEGGIEAAKQNHNVIMTPGGWCYFDHTQSENEDSVTIGGFTPIEKVYSYEPVPKELGSEKAKYVLGAQGNVWTEYMKNTSKVEYMIFPRMSALSEVLWTGKEKRDWSDFEKRLMTQFKRYDLWKANYSKAYFDLKAIVLPNEKNEGLYWQINVKKTQPVSLEYIRPTKANVTDTFPVYDISDPTKVVRYKIIKAGDVYMESSSNQWFDMKEKELFKATESGEHFVKAYNIYTQPGLKPIIDKSPFTIIKQIFHFNKATGKKITLTNPPSDKYAAEGAFTLVNGIQNETGFSKAREFLGFLGTNCETVIDLGSFGEISSVTVHALRSVGAWIWQPHSVEVYSSVDNQYFSKLGSTTEFIETSNGNGTMTIRFDSTPTQFVKIVIKNQGIIPENNPGAGSKAWLFVDEIEVH